MYVCMCVPQCACMLDGVLVVPLEVGGDAQTPLLVPLYLHQVTLCCLPQLVLLRDLGVQIVDGSNGLHLCT